MAASNGRPYARSSLLTAVEGKAFQAAWPDATMIKKWH